MGKEIRNDYGSIDISESVIATIAGAAAIECYGLVGMSSRKSSDKVVQLLGRENLSKGIVVEIEENEVTIELFIVVGYGTRISEVATNVMERVRYTVENLTGFTVNKVNINVESVRILE
ncbi:MAG: Asp23/Gls24 family envelope stress response protein [Peptococcaceae bacterium]|jgi:uncharacterized alkaline shock family protein YloU|nr:Asp23/Gls24 family envelope stress response protein [Peptococcaceae bacterium]